MAGSLASGLTVATGASAQPTTISRLATTVRQRRPALLTGQRWARAVAIHLRSEQADLLYPLDGLAA